MFFYQSLNLEENHELRLLFIAYALQLTNWALGRGVCIYTYLGGTPSIGEPGPPTLSMGGTDAIPRKGGVSSGVSCLHRSGRGTHVVFHLRCISVIHAVTSW